MITLTTDFSGSEYVGALKGVIYTLNPEARIVDITHSIRAFDVRHGAYAIYSTYPFFPPRTVHMVVVDPGVGAGRRGIIISSKGHLFVGPDNGVFSLIDAEDVYELKEPSPATPTFHGRDVFAPVAARLDLGVEPGELGRRIEGYDRSLRREVEVRDVIRGEVLCIDAFGNAVTYIRREHMVASGLKDKPELKMEINGRELSLPFVKTYGEVEKGGLACLINSFGHLEIAVREGSAAEALGLRGGEEVEVYS